jgi:hypothetical protein
MLSKNPDPNPDTVSIADLRAENLKLRLMLALASCGATLYGDDGEMSDCSVSPFIDFKRDPADTIQAKLITRAQNRMHDESMMNSAPSDKVVIDYTNYHGVRSFRHVQIVRVYYGSTEYHPEKQWLMEAKDLNKNEMRTFAIKDIHMWRGPINDLLSFFTL